MSAEDIARRVEALFLLGQETGDDALVTVPINYIIAESLKDQFHMGITYGLHRVERFDDDHGLVPVNYVRTLIAVRNSEFCPKTWTYSLNVKFKAEHPAYAKYQSAAYFDGYKDEVLVNWHDVVMQELREVGVIDE